MGQVVGVSRNPNEQLDAFITGPDGVGMTDRGTLGEGLSTAYGINDAGQVVGFSSTAGGETHAFITGPNGAGMTDLASVVIFQVVLLTLAWLLPSITMGNWLCWQP